MNTAAPTTRRPFGGVRTKNSVRYSTYLQYRQEGFDREHARLTDGVADADGVVGRPVAVVPTDGPLDRVVLGGGELGHGGHCQEGGQSLHQQRGHFRRTYGRGAGS